MWYFYLLKLNLFLFLFFSLCIPVTATGKVDVDYDHTIDFEKFNTFALHETDSSDNPILQRRIEMAVRRQLISSGLIENNFEPDLYVFPHFSTRAEQRVYVSTPFFYSYYGYGWGPWGGYPSTVNVYYIEIGTLMIDLVDSDSNQLVWRGIATNTVRSTAKKNTKLLYKNLRKMFKKFPPIAP